MMKSTLRIVLFGLTLASMSMLSLAQEFPEGPAQKAQKYDIGLQLYSVRDACATDFDGTVRAVAKLGFSGVEFAGYYGRSAEQLRKLLDENGLKCYGTHIQINDLIGEKFAKTVEFNRILGNKFLGIASLPGDRTNTKAAILDTAKLFNEIAKKLEPYDMYIGFHNHAHEFQKIDGELIWDLFFSNTDFRVGIQFDTGNAMSAGFQAAPFLNKFPGRVLSTHVKDFSKSNPDGMLGEGEVNWADVVKFYKSRNRPRWYIIEQENYPFPSLVCAEKCLANFKKMMGIK